MSIGQPYQLSVENQGKVDVFVLTTGVNTEKALGFNARGLIVDNLTNQWIFIREVFAFIPPYVSGRSIPLGGTQKLSVVYQTPTGFSQQTAVAGQQAFFRATENSVSSAPGVPVAPAPTRWNIASLAGAGVIPSVTKSGVPGVIHVGDHASWSLANFNSTTSSVNTCFLRDGASGGGTVLWGEYLGVALYTTAATNTANSRNTLGPGAGLRGTVGVAMTLEMSGAPGAVVAATYYSTNMVGYDQ